MALGEMFSLFQIFGPIEPGYLNDEPGKYRPWAGGSGMAFFLSNLLKAALLTAGLAAFAFLIFGGFRYLTAGGDEKATGDAQKVITNAVVGLAIIVAAWLIVRIIESVFGVSILAPVFYGPD